jgi:hypothetical protein
LEVECPLTENRQREAGRQIAESQLSELQNTRVLLEEARGLSRNLAYHRRARLEATIGGALDKVHRQIVMIAPGGIPMGNGHSRVACIRCAGSIAPILRVPPLRRPRSLHPENLRSSPRQRIPRRARTNRYRSASLLAPWTRREAREGTIG